MLRKTLVLQQFESKKKQEDDEDNDTFREEDFELPSEELHKLIETEKKRRSISNVPSAYDRLSILDTISSPIRTSGVNTRNGSKINSTSVMYSPTSSNFSYPSSLNPNSAVGQPTQPLQLSRYQKSITKVENNVKNEIQLVKLCLADEDKTLTSFEKTDIINVDEDEEVSTLAKPRLGSLEEKLEDLRHESIEKWCKKRGHVAAVDFTNKDKRLLRNWFRELDYDGSGEVNVHELQDPMLSAGILRTKEQVVRVLANIDKNNTEGIDFEEFLIALRGNKLADQSKVKMLQDFSQNEFDFDMTTLLNEERRKKLIHSVMIAVEKREKRIDAVLSKLNNPRTTKREKNKFSSQLAKAEESCNKSRKLHEMYISSLNGVVQDKKEWEAQQQKQSLHAHHHQAFSEWEEDKLKHGSHLHGHHGIFDRKSQLSELRNHGLLNHAGNQLHMLPSEVNAQHELDEIMGLGPSMPSLPSTKPKSPNNMQMYRSSGNRKIIWGQMQVEL